MYKNYTKSENMQLEWSTDIASKELKLRKK